MSVRFRVSIGVGIYGRGMDASEGSGPPGFLRLCLIKILKREGVYRVALGACDGRSEVFISRQAQHDL